MKMMQHHHECRLQHQFPRWKNGNHRSSSSVSFLTSCQLQLEPCCEGLVDYWQILSSTFSGRKNTSLSCVVVRCQATFHLRLQQWLKVPNDSSFHQSAVQDAIRNIGFHRTCLPLTNDHKLWFVGEHRSGELFLFGEGKIAEAVIIPGNILDQDVSAELEGNSQTSKALSENLHKLEKWLRTSNSMASLIQWCMLTVGKCPRKSLDGETLSLQLSLNDKEIEIVENHKLLGLKIDQDSTYDEHIDELCKKLSKRIGRLRHISSKKQRLVHSGWGFFRVLLLLFKFINKKHR